MRNRDNDVKFLQQLMQTIAVQTNVSQLCRVVNISSDKTTVDAQPMALTQENEKRAMLLNVHVGRMLRDEIKVGDVVVVIFLDRSIANWDKSNRDFQLDHYRTHDLNDAFVVEVY